MTQEEQMLRDALTLIDTPQKWTQNAFARDASGEACLIEDPAAVCWCATGAIVKALGRFPKGTDKDPSVTTDCGIAAADYMPLKDRLLVELAAGFCGRFWEPADAEYADKLVENYNDASDTDHEEVVRAFTRAIAAVRENRSKADTTPG